MNEITKYSKEDTKAQVIGKTIFKLALISLLVGVFMSFFDITPQTILENFGESVAKAYEIMTGWLRWMVPYILLGATIVIPIWAILALLRLGGRKKNKSE
jgi:Na+/H+-dicarboxylate symporter